METPAAEAHVGAHKKFEESSAGERFPATSLSTPAAGHDDDFPPADKQTPTELTPETHNPSPEKMDGVVTGASNDCEHSPQVSPKGARAEIDTAAPFESVKEAVILFGDRKDWKPQLQTSSVEREIRHGLDLQKVQEDLTCYKEQLCLTEASTADAILELEKTKELIQMWRKTHEVSNTLANEGTVPQVMDPLNQPKEVPDVGLPKELHTSVIGELQMVRKEIEGVKEELSLLAGSKQAASRESEEALNTLNMVLNRVEKLTSEYASSNEALAAAQASLVEENVESLKGSQKLAALKSLELNLDEVNMLIKKLKEELSVIRDFEAKASLSASESEGNMANMNSKVEQAKAAESDCVAALGRVLEELDEVNANLSKATEHGASLASAVLALQSEVEKDRLELERAHDKEQMACATLASLQDEICSVRDLLMSAQAGEAKARDAKKTLPTAIKQVASEADKAKAAAKVAKEEVRKFRHEIEQAKASTSTATSRLQAAQKEAEAARASEAMSLAEFKAVSESEAKLPVLEVQCEGGGATGISMSLEEYSMLNHAVHEAEEVANKKVVAIIVQVEAAKASQRDAQAKLDIASKEAEATQNAMEQAQKKADDALEAKLAVEAQLRKWRAEHEQQRKTRETGNTPLSVDITAAHRPQDVKAVSQGKGMSQSFQDKTVVGLDSLAEVLSLKVPPLEKAVTQGKGMSQSFQDKTVVGLDSLAEVLSLKVPPLQKPFKVLPADHRPKKAGRVKKMTFFSRIMSFVVRRKRKFTK